MRIGRQVGKDRCVVGRGSSTYVKPVDRFIPASIVETDRHEG
jgi:hypothetical protein